MSTASQHTDHTIDGTPIPTLDEIAEQHMALAPWVARTPTFERHDFPTLEGTPVTFKFELLQASGTFKARGAFSNLLALDAKRARRGASRACRRAITRWPSRMRRCGMEIGAKVVMIRSGEPDAHRARAALWRRNRVRGQWPRSVRDRAPDRG